MATDTTPSDSIPVSEESVHVPGNGQPDAAEALDQVDDPIREHLAEWRELTERIQGLWPSVRHQLEFSIDPSGIDSHGRAHVTARIVGQPFCISDFPLEVLQCLCKELDPELYQFGQSLEDAECREGFGRPLPLVDADEDESQDSESDPEALDSDPETAEAERPGGDHVEDLVPKYRPHAATPEPEADRTAETVESPNGSDTPQPQASGG